MEIDNATRPLRPSGVPGRWTASSELRRGDSYTAEVYDPEPTAGELRQANRTGLRVARSDQLELTLPFLLGRRPTVRSVGGVTDGRIDEAVVHFRPFGDDDVGYVTYPKVQRTRYDAIDSTFRRSPYARTWELAKEFRATAETPFEYILLVNSYLRGGEFGYSERPQQPPAGRAPLDFFLIDSKEGYCQHFSGAMALLLRMGGIPARVATGFSPGGFSKRRDAWIVRDTDAHAWVEAWFDELGWITYDPTPDSTPRARRSPRWRRRRPRSPPRRPRPTRRPAAASARSSRACCGRTCSSTRCATAPPRRPTSRARAGPGGSGR